MKSYGVGIDRATEVSVVPYTTLRKPHDGSGIDFEMIWKRMCGDSEVRSYVQQQKVRKEGFAQASETLKQHEHECSELEKKK